MTWKIAITLFSKNSYVNMLCHLPETEAHSLGVEINMNT